MKLEQRLRPRPGIGWNEAAGGIHGGGKAPKKERTRTLMRLAALDRYTDPLERERTSRFVKEGLKDIDRRGSNNAHFGKPHSEEAKEKIRQRIKDRGKKGLLAARIRISGRKRTDEQRRAISEGTKRAIERAGGLTPDQRQRQAANTLRGDRHPKRQRENSAIGVLTYRPPRLYRSDAARLRSAPKGTCRSWVRGKWICWPGTGWRN